MGNDPPSHPHGPHCSLCSAGLFLDSHHRGNLELVEVNNIPRAAWPDIRDMYLNQGMTRQQIADHYGTTMYRIVTALRHMECTLPKEEANRRNIERIKAFNIGRRRAMYLPKRPVPPYPLSGLINAASMVTRSSTNDIKAHRRNRYLVRIRWAIWYLAQGHFSYSAIARTFNRDHATVIYGCREARKLIETDALFRDMVAIIRSEALRTKERQRQEVEAILERIAA